MKKTTIAIVITFIFIFSSHSVETCGAGMENGYSVFEIEIPDPLFNILPPTGEISSNIVDQFSDQTTVFTENFGQLDNDEVLFYNRAGDVWFTADGVFFELSEYAGNMGHGSGVRGRCGVMDQEPQSHTPTHSQTPAPTHSQTHAQKYECVMLKLEFIGANQVLPVGRIRSSWNNNYFYGNDSTKWCTDVPNFAEVWFFNLYEKIDLRYYNSERGLKYDFILHPGADLRDIQLCFQGMSTLSLDQNGDLLISTPIGYIKDNKPVIYQSINGIKTEIKGGFKLLNRNCYTFDIMENYNLCYPLIVDPLLEYSTYLGGGSTDIGYSISIDKLGNSYVTGKTYSSTFPTTPGVYNRTYSGSYDIFVSKLNHNGSQLIFSTYLGGNHNDYAYDITLEPNGNSFITGTTRSADFPVTQNAYDTSKNSGYSPFVAKLNHNGSKLIYSTFVHGSSSSGDEGQAIAIDSLGNAYVAGITSSNDFDTTTGAFDTGYNGLGDGFVFKLNQTGQKLVYSTYIGGTNLDNCFDISVDATGNVYVTGETSSKDFPNTTGAFDNSLNGSYDGFILKLNQTGKGVIYSTYIGGSSDDHGYSLAIDSKGNALITGETNSMDFPTTTGAKDQSYNGNVDAFVLNLNYSGDYLRFSTFIGGNSIDRAYALTLDAAGNVYVTGTTVSSDFPLTPDAYNDVLNGYDIFLTKLSNDGSNLLYSTLMGGALTEYVEGIAVDSFGGVYVIGSTSSSNFPVTDEGYDNKYAGNWDAVIFKFSFKPKLGITSLELLRSNILTAKAYSRLDKYTFRVCVIHSGNTTDLKDVYLTLDPQGADIELHWNKTINSFVKNNDPNGYVSLEPSSVVSNNMMMWTIDFDVTFNWNYPDEYMHDVQVYATSTSLPTAWYNGTDFYQVETDLEFEGEMVIKNENNESLYNYSIVGGETKIFISGLKVVYENTIDIYPAGQEFNIALEDNFGNFWNESPDQGEEIKLEVILPKVTATTGYKLILTITGVPDNCIVGNRSFILRIDSNNVVFLNITPFETTWNIDKDVLVELNITDIGGSVVDGKSVMRSTSMDNGSIWSEWEQIIGLKSATHLDVRERVRFEEGVINLIKWRAADLVGNGPVESEPHRILIDTEPVQFSDPWPSYDDVSKSEVVEFGITISDETSGVNASSIQYSKSLDNGKTWTVWSTIQGMENGRVVYLHINDTFLNGTNNMVKWRACDIAGNGPRISPLYLINVNTWVPQDIPKVNLISPPSGIKINTTNTTLIWELEGTKSVNGNVTYDIYFDIFSPPELFLWNYNNTSYTKTGLQFGVIYYWRVVPKLVETGTFGICRSGVWWFEVEQEKSVVPPIEDIINISISGINSISMYQGENKNIELLISNNGKNSILFKLSFETGELLRYIELDDYSPINLSEGSTMNRNLLINLPETAKTGVFKLAIKAILLDAQEPELASYELTVDIKARSEQNNNNTKPPPIINGTDKNGTDGGNAEFGLFELVLYSGIIGVIIIILIIIVFMIIRKRKADFANKFRQMGGHTIKPSTHYAPVVTIGDAHSKLEPVLGQLRTTNIVQQIVPSNANAPMGPKLPLVPQGSTQGSQQALGGSTSSISPTPVQVQTTLQMPHAIQKPQLPPADKEKIEDK